MYPIPSVKILLHEIFFVIFLVTYIDSFNRDNNTTPRTMLVDVKLIQIFLWRNINFVLVLKSLFFLLVNGS